MTLWRRLLKNRAILDALLVSKLDESLSAESKVALARLRNAFPYDWSRSVAVCANPRGGSTWLAEIVSQLPASSILWEPLALDRNPEMQEAGLQWDPYLGPNDEHASMKSYLAQVLQGRLLNQHTLSRNHWRQVWATCTWVVKFCHANTLLPWMARHFPIRGYLYLVRHPCAVVASQLNLFRRELPPYVPGFLEAHPEFREVIRGLSTAEEFHAADWCLTNYELLRGSGARNWLLVTYEALVKRGPEELSRIFGYLGSDIPAGATERLECPSSTVALNSTMKSGLDRLTGWQGTLSSDQVKQILSVVKKFHLDEFYGDDCEPNYSALFV